MAFAQNTNPEFIKQPQNGKLQLLNANAAGTFVTLYTAGASGSKVSSITAASSGTIAHDLQIAITNGGTTYLLGTVAVAIGAGNTSGVPSTNLLSATNFPGLPLDSDGNPFILLVFGDTLQINPVVVVTSPLKVNIVAASVGDF